MFRSLSPKGTFRQLLRDATQAALFIFGDEFAQRRLIQTVKNVDQLRRALFTWGKAGISAPKCRYHRIAVLLGDTAILIAMAIVKPRLFHGDPPQKDRSTPELLSRSIGQPQHGLQISA
jgi:hypothetical protein